MQLLAPASESGVISAPAHPAESASDFDDLVDLAGSATFVLIGEASHGTREFYATRAMLTRRLIEEKNFRLVALEADWPDTLRVHRYLATFPEMRIPLRPWRTFADSRRGCGAILMVKFVQWMRDWNLKHPEASCGIFGLDLYSLHASIEAVLRYLDKIDPEAAARARERYACFEFFGRDPQVYGYATVREGIESCEVQVVAQLVDLQRRYGEIISRDGQLAEDEFLYAEQNARLVANAERYYRLIFRGREDSWNLRDEH